MKKIPCGGFYIDDDTLEVNDNILKVKNGGSSGLPIVTEDDNGDVLTVVEGAWAKAAPSGGGGFVLPYEIIIDEVTFMETWEINGGYEDVKNAICFTNEEGYLYVKSILPGGEMTSRITAFGIGYDSDISAYIIKMYTFEQNEEGTKYVYTPDDM